MFKELLIGCGSRATKDLSTEKSHKFKNLTRLDNNPDHKSDVLWDLTKHPLPFPDNEFDEIHAYDVLEHLAHQGDYKFFFAEFSEYWRILKKDGLFFASVPALDSVWKWGDPSHKRVIVKENLTFLSQDEYTKQIGVTKMSDFRNIYKANFKSVHIRSEGTHFYFILQVIK